MRYISINKATSGMVLAKTIYDGKGRTLLGGGSHLTDFFIHKLAQRGYPGVYIEDELSKDIEIQETISQELRNRGVEALRQNNVDETLKIAHEIVQQIIQSSRVSLDMIDLREFDDYTYRHSVNVAVLSTIIGMKMEFHERYLEELAVAAIFHDIGKLMIDQNILNKKGYLTLDEFNIVKQHPVHGYNLLKERIDISARVRYGILYHHENEDGTGYPEGLTSDKIYIYAKVIHVVDVFDALTSRRPYKEAYQRGEAVEYLMASGGTLFDYEIVKNFLKSVLIYPKGVTVRLSTGQDAIVVGNTENNLRPKVRLMSGEELDLSDSSKYRNITIVSSCDVE